MKRIIKLKQRVRNDEINYQLIDREPFNGLTIT